MPAEFKFPPRDRSLDPARTRHQANRALLLCRCGPFEARCAARSGAGGHHRRCFKLRTAKSQPQRSCRTRRRQWTKDDRPTDQGSVAGQDRETTARIACSRRTRVAHRVRQRGKPFARARYFTNQRDRSSSFRWSYAAPGRAPALTESVLLSFIGAVVGVGLAAIGVRMLDRCRSAASCAWKK